jgi:hypothetical protein
MSRTFKTVDYQATLDVTVPLGDLLPPEHLARFVVDTVAQLNRGGRLRIMPSLWKMRDAVVASTLQFSCMHTRDASPRGGSA